MKNFNSNLLKIILVLTGLAIIFTGINISFGGMKTLGWQGIVGYFEVTNQQQFLTQDSHIRFLGGIWLSIGALFVISVFNIIKFKSALKFALISIFVGGLTRLSQENLDVTLGPDILGSFLGEIIFMPIIYFWISRTVKSSH